MTRRTGGYAAAVADVEVNKSTGKVTVQRVTLAHDCGLIVNPDGVKTRSRETSSKESAARYLKK